MRVKFRAEAVKDVLQVVHILTARERASIEVTMLGSVSVETLPMGGCSPVVLT